MEELTVVIGAGRFPKGSQDMNRIGGDEDSLIPSLVMEASIKRHSPETKVINTYYMDKPALSVLRNPTPFSLVRFMVPALCDYTGWALYCDADQVVFDDVRKTLDVVYAGPSIYVAKAHGCTGVILMDTSRLKGWDAMEVRRKVDNGVVKYGPMMRELNGCGSQHFGDLGEEWNSRDTYTEQTKLLHYTSLSIQPWKVPGKHPFERIWAKQLRLAIDEGFVKEDNLDKNCRKILETLKAAAG